MCSPFLMPGSKFKVSMDGGERSVWSRDGKELYFVSPDERMMAAPVKTGPNIRGGCAEAAVQGTSFQGYGCVV